MSSEEGERRKDNTTSTRGLRGGISIAEYLGRSRHWLRKVNDHRSTKNLYMFLRALNSNQAEGNLNWHAKAA